MRTTVSSLRRLALGTLAGLACSSAQAHHSYAMFDTTKEESAQAVVRIWEFSSPHAYLWVYVNDASGKPILYGLEAPGPNQLVRAGWDRETVQPGDKVQVKWNPLRTGKAGGSLTALTLADGRTLSVGGPPNAAAGSVGGPDPAAPGPGK
ncbi:MAG TPA: DUF6152 family protein [Steroidobacteraceae bacterium]|nr:DUF6152 family protein [Steroidobacteraceae bacterium]